MLQRKLICKQKGLVLSRTGTQQLPHLALSLYWIYSSKILCMSACAPFFIFGLSIQAHVRLQPQTSWQQVSQRLWSLHIPRVPEATGLRALCCLQRPVRVAELRKPSPAPMQLPAHGSATTRTGVTDGPVLLTRTAFFAAMCAHSPGYSYTSRRKRPEKWMKLVQAEVILAAVCILW